MEMGAGNTFTNSSWTDYYNSSQTDPIIYWYVGTPPSTLGSITLSETKTEDCGLGGGGSKTMAYNEATTLLVQARSELAAIEDNGDTEGTLTSVNIAGVGEELALRNELLLKSPNVSEEVLKATVQKPAPLPNAMLRDVLAANPQAGKDQGVMEAVDMLPVPMTETMQAQILTAAQSVSPKEQKDSEVAAHYIARENLASDIVIELMHDSTRYDPDAAKSFLLEKNDLQADLELMKIYAVQRDVSGMEQVQTRIDGRTDLASGNVPNLERYAEYRSLQRSLISDGKHWMNEDENTIEALWDLSTDESMAGQYAQNILEFMGLAEFEKEVILPVPQPSGKMDGTQGVTSTSGFVKVHPNPASGYIIVSYDVSHLGEGAVFELVDAVGRPLLVRVLQHTTDEVVVDVRDLKGGSYAYRVRYNGRLHYSGTVVVAD